MITLANAQELSIPIICNNEINITEEEWTFLNRHYSQEEIIQMLSDAMDIVPMPLREITFSEAMDDFSALIKFDATSLIKEGKTYARYDYKYQLMDKYIDLSVVGNKASDYFHQESRYHCDSLNAPSPYRTWTTEKFRKNVLKNLWSMPTKKVDNTRLRSCLGLRNYIASQFRPSAAKAFYTLYNSKGILDFSAGWGDRLAGFYATDTAAAYHGVDPNLRLQTGYLKQINSYGKISTPKIAYINPSPAEEMSFIPQYDTVFTSPPYFDTERYTQEENQSWKRYKKLEVWLEKFLFVVIEKSWNALKPNGILAVNIADTYGHHRRNDICDPMNDFISTLGGAEYQGALGYRMAKRPNSAAAKTGIFIEPIWVWEKIKN